jgi:hypothetical protein
MLTSQDVLQLSTALKRFSDMGLPTHKCTRAYLMSHSTCRTLWYPCAFPEKLLDDALQPWIFGCW